MSNNFMESIITAATGKDVDANGLSKMDEAKLRKSLEGNQKLGARNAVIFEREEPKFKTCKMYDPCPICDKCRNKASHLYVRCQDCNIPICVHTYNNRANMIRRENFAINVTPEVKEAIKKLGEDF